MERGSAGSPIAAAGLFAALFALPAFAQAPSPLPAPNVPVFVAGYVEAIVRGPDGSIILGGVFTAVDGVSRSNIAKLRPDGLLDMQWNPSADLEVRVLAVNAAGDVYAAGRFTEIGGQTRKGLAKLSGTAEGAADVDWNAGDGIIDVVALAPDVDGALFVGGQMYVSDGTNRGVVKLSGSSGAVDVAWAPPLSPWGRVATLAVGSGAVYVSAYSSDANCYLCKFSASGTGAAYPDWRPPPGGDPDGLATAIVIGIDGSLYVAGYSQDASGGFVPSLVKLPPGLHGASDPDWHAPSTSFEMALALDSASGALYASGYSGTAKLSEATGAVQWQAATSGVRSMALGTDDSVYLGGLFETVGEAPVQPAAGLTRLARSDGAILPTSSVGLPGTVTAIARQSSGGTIVGGRFRTAGALPRRNLLRLAPDGSLDADWNPPWTDTDAIHAVAVDSFDNVYAGGYGSTIHPSQIVKLATGSEGETVTVWNVTANNTVNAIAIDPGGDAAYVGGTFGEIDGVARLGIAKLSLHDGHPDPAWNAPADGLVMAITIDGAHRVYVGEDVRSRTPVPRSITRLSSSTGQVDPGWNPPLGGVTNALALAADGSLYAGGLYAGDNAPTHSIVKLDNRGTPVPAWRLSVDGRTTYALAVAADGSVLAGGSSFIDNYTPTLPFLTRLNGDTGAIVTAWNPAPDGTVIAALLSNPGDVWVGGKFTMIGGEPRGGLAALPTPPVPPVAPLPGHSHHAIPILMGRDRR